MPALLAAVRTAGLSLLLLPGVVSPAELTSAPFKYTADVLNSDFRSDTLELLGNVRVVQDTMSIEADQAHAAAIRSDNSRWSFERSVRLRTADADLKADVAQAAFVAGQIATARVEGAPAQFEQRSGPPDRQVHGRAGVIDYDFRRGIVKLTGDVWFSYGKEELQGCTVIYSIPEERVRVTREGDCGGPVRGTIQPGRQGTATPPAPESQRPPAGNGA